jgi:aminoglycoside phosphotransferase (APT) family kinase protein
MRRPHWAADIDVDAALATKLITAQFPALAPARVRPFGNGWDNTAYLVGERYVFRFPRRHVAVKLIERERAVLPAIAPLLPLPISAPCFVGAPTPDYPSTFLGHELIAGATACSVRLSDTARLQMASPLAGFLRALHTIEPAPLVARGLPPDELGRLDHEKRLAVTRERWEAVAAHGVGHTWGASIRWLEEHPPVPLAADARTIVHGDLYARHVVVDAGGRVAGVIDWGDVHLGDPALDIAIAHLFLPPAAHAAFRDAYGAIDERTWSVARYRAIYHALLVYEYGLQVHDADLCETARIALEFLGRSGA